MLVALSISHFLMPAALTLLDFHYYNLWRVMSQMEFIAEKNVTKILSICSAENEVPGEKTTASKMISTVTRRNKLGCL